MRKRIVIMSAEAEFRQALRQLALPDDQYEVFEAETKEEALALCRRRSVHGLIADLIDPGDVDTYKIPPGVAFFQRVTRETSGTASVLMVLPRGFKESGSWDNMFLLNVEYDFIIKPFSIEEFLLRVKRSTNSGERRRHPTSALLQKDSLAQELKFIPDAAERVALEITLHPAPDESTLIRIADLLVEARHTVGREGDVVGQLGGDTFLFVTFSDNADAVTQWVCGQVAQRLDLTLNIQPAALEDVRQRLKT